MGRSEGFELPSDIFCQDIRFEVDFITLLECPKGRNS